MTADSVLEVTTYY